MPLQPAPSATTASNPAATRNHFQFHFTGGTIGVVMEFATKNSGRFCFMFHSTIRAAVCSAAIFAATALRADNDPFPSRAEHAFQDAQRLARKEPTNTAANVRFAQAAFEWAEFARKDSERED